ncbi:MAG: hypothetical protein KC503_07890, partial [Myxococcales bacterium]|nr:hypothetical protein [Myxococcales bacterium]
TDMRDVLAALALRLSDPITITTSLGGVAALWRDRERGGWRVVAALCALPLLNLVLLAGVRHIFDRHALPLLPFVALFAGLGWAEARRAIAARVKRVPARQLLVAALALAIFAWPAWRSLHLDWKRLQPDTRTVAARWINAHVTPGARICSDWYMPPLSSSRYRIRRVWSLCGRRLSDLRARCDVAIASSASYARYFRDDKPTTLSLIRRLCYDELFRGWPRLARFEAPGKPTIQVFRRP